MRREKKRNPPRLIDTFIYPTFISKKKKKNTSSYSLFSNFLFSDVAAFFHFLHALNFKDVAFFVFVLSHLMVFGLVGLGWGGRFGKRLFLLPKHVSCIIVVLILTALFLFSGPLARRSKSRNLRYVKWANGIFENEDDFAKTTTNSAAAARMASRPPPIWAAPPVVHGLTSEPVKKVGTKCKSRSDLVGLCLNRVIN